MNIALDSSLQCKAAALFMHDLSPATSTLIFLFLLLSIPYQCVSMGDIVQDHPHPHPPQKCIFQPTLSNPSPPTYFTLKTQSLIPTTITASKLPEVSPISDFVFGSVLFFSICAALFTLALCIQRFAYCPQHYNAALRVEVALFWTLFAGECVAGCYAAGCWVVLLRDLWGERGRKALPIQKETVVAGVLTAVISPLLLLWAVGRMLRRFGARDFLGGGL
jgi:hypothetical protein